MLERIEWCSLWAALVFSTLGLWFSVAKILFDSGSKAASLLKVLHVLIACCLFIGLFARGFSLERFPLANMYESLLFFASGAACVMIFWSERYNFLNIPTFIIVSGLLIAAVLLPETQRAALPLLPALRSNWRIIHVPPLMVSYAFFVFSGFAGAAYLCTKQDIFRGRFAVNLELCDEVIYRCIACGFPLLTFGIITGAIWANESWGNLWQWDPKENLALVTWFCYAAYLHLRNASKVSSQTLAWIAILGVLATYLTYIGINQFELGGVHSYGKV